MDLLTFRSGIDIGVIELLSPLVRHRFIYLHYFIQFSVRVAQAGGQTKMRTDAQAVASIPIPGRRSLRPVKNNGGGKF